MDYNITYKPTKWPQSNKVSGLHTKQFLKEKGKSKRMIVIGKHTSDGRIYLIANTKIKMSM